MSTKNSDNNNNNLEEHWTHTFNWIYLDYYGNGIFHWKQCNTWNYYKKILITLVLSSLSTVEYDSPLGLLYQHQLVHLNHVPQIRSLHTPAEEIQYFGTYSWFSPSQFKNNVMTRVGLVKSLVSTRTWSNENYKEPKGSKPWNHGCLSLKFPVSSRPEAKASCQHPAASKAHPAVQSVLGCYNVHNVLLNGKLFFEDYKLRWLPFKSSLLTYCINISDHITIISFADFLVIWCRHKFFKTFSPTRKKCVFAWYLISPTCKILSSLNVCELVLCNGQVNELFLV